MNSSEKKKATLLIVEKDDDLHPLFKRHFTSQGYRVILACDEENALTMCKELKVPADVILINQMGMSIPEAFTLGHQLRQYADMERTTPLIVIAQTYTDESLDGQDIAVGEHDYISYCTDIEQLYALLQRLLPTPERFAHL